MNVPLLVSTEWLAGRLSDPGIRIADVRWSLLEKDKGRNSYLQGHIPGAVFMDVDGDLASPRGQGPGRHPLPRPEVFAERMSRAGIGAGTHVIAHDFGDGSTAARLPEPHPGMMVDADAVERLRTDPRTLILDSRMAERYEGKVEPIDPVAGHIPGAKSRPYPVNVRSAEDPRFLEPERLREQFMQLGAGHAERVVCYCGSGVNACQNLFALRLAGFDTGLLYEGSWSDWCSVSTRAMSTGTR
jgi:thiosulfate/3-mercaptopyruvate sulfurtransferase